MVPYHEVLADSRLQGCFPFSQNAWFNRLKKCKWFGKTFGVTPFCRSNGLERNPFPFSCLLCHHVGFLMYQWDCKFGTTGKKFFHLTRKVSRISNRQFWVNGKQPSGLRSFWSLSWSPSSFPESLLFPSASSLSLQHSRPQSRLVLLTAGGWARGPSRGTGGSGDENVALGDGKRRDLGTRLSRSLKAIHIRNWQLGMKKKKTTRHCGWIFR